MQLSSSPFLLHHFHQCANILLFFPIAKKKKFTHRPHDLSQLLPHFSASLYIRTSCKGCLCLESLLDRTSSPNPLQWRVDPTAHWKHSCRCHQWSQSHQTLCSIFSLPFLDFWSTFITVTFSLLFETFSSLNLQENTIFFHFCRPLYSGCFRWIFYSSKYLNSVCLMVLGSCLLHYSPQAFLSNSMT